jgi:hypothetical protein
MVVSYSRFSNEINKVFYEVPQGKREEVKQKFIILIKNQIILQKY